MKEDTLTNSGVLVVAIICAFIVGVAFIKAKTDTEAIYLDNGERVTANDVIKYDLSCVGGVVVNKNGDTVINNNGKSLGCLNEQ